MTSQKEANLGYPERFGTPVSLLCRRSEGFAVSCDPLVDPAPSWAARGSQGWVWQENEIQRYLAP